MKNKNLLTGVTCLGAGLLLGFLMCGTSSQSQVVSNQGMHMMPNGTIMNNDGMSMVAMMADMNAALAEKKGDAFDKAFIQEMTIHHEGAIAMAEHALASAKHQEIKDLANDIISAQTTEINKMRQWETTWYSQ